MSTRGHLKSWLAVLGLAILAAAGFREFQRAASARDDLARAIRVRDGLREQLARAEGAARPGMGEGALTAGGRYGAAAGAAGRMAGVFVSTVMSQSLAVMEPEVAAATDPAVRELHLRVFDAELEANWGLLLRQLNLPPAKLAVFKALLRRHEERRLDVTAVAAEQKLSAGDAVIRKMRAEDGMVLWRAMQELLGPEDAKVYQEFRREREVQSPIADIAGRIYFTATPLTVAESEQLRAIFAGNSERTAGGFVRARSLNWETALPAIEGAGAFSAATIAACRQMAEDWKLSRRMDARLDEIGTRMVGPEARRDIWWPSVPALEPRR